MTPPGTGQGYRWLIRKCPVEEGECADKPRETESGCRGRTEDRQKVGQRDKVA